jgi:hypothetical protein
MANAFQGRVGVTTEERVINAFNIGSDVSTKNIGMAVARQRGVAGKPILVNSLKEDKRIFGDHISNMYSSYVVENLFNNLGGYPVNLYQLRVVGAGSLASKVVVKNASANTQQIAVTTIQNSSSTQSQKNSIAISNVGVGDVFNYTISGMDDMGGVGTPFSQMVSFTATTTVVNDVLVGLKNLLDTFFSGLVDAYTSTIVGGNLVIESPINSAYTSTVSSTNEPTSEDIFEVVAGRGGDEDAGDWGNSLRVRVYPINHPNGSSDGYKMEVFYQGYLVENFISNGTNWQTLVDIVNQNSEYVLINAVNLSVALELGVFDSALSGGVYVAPTQQNFDPRYNAVTGEAEGLAIFEGVDVQILACPEVFSPSFVKLCDDFARTNLKFFVFNMPYLANESVLETYYNALFTPDQSFIGGYLNWVEVPADSNGNKIWIPSIGYVLGAGYIKKAGLYNGYVWTPPAGTETNAKGIFRITHDTLSEDTLSRFIKKWRCNVMKFVKNVGFCTWSSRTYSNNPLFESIHIRLETNWIIQNLKIRNEKFLQRLITPSLYKEQRTDNLIWFKNIYEQGGIERSISFADAVVITIEQSKENRKETEMEIAWIPPECNEHIHIKVSRNDGVLIINF